MPMTKRTRRWLLVLTLILSAILLLALWGAYGYWYRIDLGSRAVTIEVHPGDPFGSVAAELADSGVVTSSFWLKWPARLQGIDRRLVPGRYEFTGANSGADILEQFRSGRIVRVKITIPEGSPIWAVASAARLVELDSAEFVALNTDHRFLAELGVPCLEGYLFPETYFFSAGISCEQMATEMVRMFLTKTDSLWFYDLPLGFNRPEIITLSSVIEAEAKLAGERDTIASVYINRLRSGMPMDADPTVIYGLGGLRRPLSEEDLAFDTPYNTYLHPGLPPSPINSPGLASIRAAVHPAVTDYYYFVADTGGVHLFSRTNDEHNSARSIVRRHARNRQ
jgi:UPF0755 protein